MDKTINQKAWFLVLPVFLAVAFSAILPLMTVVNYSMQDTFGNNQFFWNGVGWFKELLDPTTDLGGRFLASLWRNLFFSAVILAIEVPLGIVVALSMPREGWTVAACLVILALPLLIPWNVVGTIWQIFGRPDIGLLGYALNSMGLHYNYVSNEFDAWATVTDRRRVAMGGVHRDPVAENEPGAADRGAAAVHGQFHDLYRAIRGDRRRSG